MRELRVVPFSAESLEAVLEFCERWPGYPHTGRTQVARFISSFASSESHVFDLHQGEDRVAVAVLLDRVDNAGNFAFVEVVGIDGGRVSLARLFKDLTPWADERVRCTSRAGWVITAHESAGLKAEFFASLGLEFYYSSYDMENLALERHGRIDSEVVEADEGQEKDYYECLVRSFKDNVDVGVPDFDDWSRARDASRVRCHDFLTTKDGRIAGFLHMTFSNDLKNAEVRTVGVLPEFRGQSLGRRLLEHALAVAHQAGATSCRLTVAAGNEKALGLYQKVGFSAIDRADVYCRRRA